MKMENITFLICDSTAQTLTKPVETDYNDTLPTGILTLSLTALFLFLLANFRAAPQLAEYLEEASHCVEVLAIFVEV